MLPSCPNCLDSSSVREILYGLPEEPVDESKYSIGGCLVWEGMPLFRCSKCNWISSDLAPAPREVECWYCGQVEGLRQINFKLVGTKDYGRFVWDGGSLELDPNPIYKCSLCGWSGSHI